MVNIDEMNLPDPNDLLSSKSVPSVSFKDAKVGDSYTGVITNLETAQVRNYDSGEPEFWDDGKPKLQIVVTLDTDYIDPELEGDDGTRKVYLAGQKLTAAKQAMKEAGIQKLEKGFKFTISYVGTKPSSNKKYNDVKLYGIAIVPSKSNVEVDALLADTLGATPAKAEAETLTDEQKTKITKLSAAGFSDEEIAEALGVNKYSVVGFLELI
jgi:DNA polymerase I-like protein with 3'-5' exonuclease and polymerase domains